MPVQQYGVLIGLAPYIETVLKEKGEEMVPRPVYDGQVVTDHEDSADEEDEAEDSKEEGETGGGNGALKQNFEATSDEEED